MRSLTTNAAIEVPLKRNRSFVGVSLVVMCCLTLIIPVLLSSYDYSVAELFLAMILLDICLYPTVRYIAYKEKGIPVLPLICLSYALQFATPIFTQEAKQSVLYDYVYLEHSDVIAALLMSIVGVGLLEYTYYFTRKISNHRALPTVSLKLNKRKAEIYCVLVIFISLFVGNIQTILSPQIYQQFSAIVGLIQNQILVAIGVLGWIVYTNQGRKWHKILLYSVVIGLACLKGFSSTMLEQMMAPIIILLITKWLYTRKLPVLGFISIALFILFLSPVKSDIRADVVEEVKTEAQTSITDRAFRWIDLSAKYWADAFTGKRDLGDSTADAATRTDLIHQFAYIYSSTPSAVPYQYGATYTYFAIALIPRVFWPEKPEANSANNFFAVSYGILTEEGAKTTAVGVTVIGEGYMNFGLPGVLLIMGLQGILLCLLETIFAGPNSGSGAKAIFIALFVFFLNGIGSSTELMFGGVLQNLICNGLLLWWASEGAVKHQPLKTYLGSPYLIKE